MLGDTGEVNRRGKRSESRLIRWTGPDHHRAQSEGGSKLGPGQRDIRRRRTEKIRAERVCRGGALTEQRAGRCVCERLQAFAGRLARIRISGTEDTPPVLSCSFLSRCVARSVCLATCLTDADCAGCAGWESVLSCEESASQCCKPGVPVFPEHFLGGSGGALLG